MDRVLLFLASVFLATSGALKIRSVVKHRLGTPVLPGVELAAAVIVAALAVMGAAPGGLGLGIISMAVVLLIGSSARHATKLATHRAERSHSEASRLANYVRYLSGPAEDSD